RPTAFISRAKGWSYDTLLITRASASRSPACAVTAPESRSATVSDLPERLSMPPRAALVPKRQFRDRPVIRQPPRAVRATCPCPSWHASAECHRAAYARSACERPRRRQTASCSRVRTEREEVRAPAPRVLPPDGHRGAHPSHGYGSCSATYQPRSSAAAGERRSRTVGVRWRAG